MPYSAKIKDARQGFSLPDNAAYLDIWFDIYFEGKAVADRRLAFPLGTTKKAIVEELKKYCLMYENDHKLAAEAAKRSALEVEAAKTLASLKNEEIN